MSFYLMLDCMTLEQRVIKLTNLCPLFFVKYIYTHRKIYKISAFFLFCEKMGKEGGGCYIYNNVCVRTYTRMCVSRVNRSIKHNPFYCTLLY